MSVCKCFMSAIRCIANTRINKYIVFISFYIKIYTRCVNSMSGCYIFIYVHYLSNYRTVLVKTQRNAPRYLKPWINRAEKALQTSRSADQQIAVQQSSSPATSRPAVQQTSRPADKQTRRLADKQTSSAAYQQAGRQSDQ